MANEIGNREKDYSRKDAKGAKGNALGAERKATKDINRRFTQMDAERKPFKNITAEAQRAQRIKFLFVGRRRQTKTLLKLEQKGFPQRTLRLCGEMSEFLSARICG